MQHITAGYSLAEISDAYSLASEHWRVLNNRQEPVDNAIIRFCGSSDTIVNLLAEEFGELSTWHPNDGRSGWQPGRYYSPGARPS